MITDLRQPLYSSYVTRNFSCSPDSSQRSLVWWHRDDSNECVKCAESYSKNWLFELLRKRVVQSGITSKYATSWMMKNNTSVELWTQVGYFWDTIRMRLFRIWFSVWHYYLQVCLFDLLFNYLNFVLLLIKLFSLFSNFLLLWVRLSIISTASLTKFYE